MDIRVWKIKIWKYKTLEEAEIREKQRKEWMERWEHKYRFREVFVNNAYAIEYIPLIHIDIR